MQLIEIYYNVQSDNGSITDQHALRQWSSQFMGSLDDQKDLRVGTRLKTLLNEAGFGDVDTRMIPIPLSPWSNGTVYSRFSGISKALILTLQQTQG